MRTARARPPFGVQSQSSNRSPIVTGAKVIMWLIRPKTPNLSDVLRFTSPSRCSRFDRSLLVFVGAYSTRSRTSMVCSRTRFLNQQIPVLVLNIPEQKRGHFDLPGLCQLQGAP